MINVSFPTAARSNKNNNLLNNRTTCSSDDQANRNTRSLRRTKKKQTLNSSHYGTTERRRKKLSVVHPKDDKNTNQEEIPNLNKSDFLIKPIDIEVVSISPVIPSVSFDGQKVWAEMESIMASFESSILRKSPSSPVLMMSSSARINGNPSPNAQVNREQQESNLLHPNRKPDEKTFQVKPGLEGVRDFLFSIDLPDYTPLMISHGFDDVRFMGPPVMEEADLKGVVGIKSLEDVKKILTSAKKKLPKMHTLGREGSGTVKEWLSSLELSEYEDKFRENGFTNLDKVRKIWEVELYVVLDIAKVGHRKRILANLGERTSLMSDLGLDDLDFDRDKSNNSVTPEPLTTVPASKQEERKEMKEKEDKQVVKILKPTPAVRTIDTAGRKKEAPKVPSSPLNTASCTQNKIEKDKSNGSIPSSSSSGLKGVMREKEKTEDDKGREKNKSCQEKYKNSPEVLKRSVEDTKKFFEEKSKPKEHSPHPVLPPKPNVRSSNNMNNINVNVNNNNSLIPKGKPVPPAKPASLSPRSMDGF